MDNVIVPETNDPVFRDAMEASSPTFAMLLQRRCKRLIADMVAMSPDSREYKIASTAFWYCFDRLNVLFQIGERERHGSD